MMFMFNLLVPIACVGVLMNSSFNSGSGTRLVALMIFTCGVVWVIYGAMLARKLNNGYVEFTASGFFLRRYGKDTRRTGQLTLGFLSAVAVDKAVAKFVLQFAPYPLNYFYWMGMYPYVPFLIFGVLPSIFTFWAVGPVMSLAAVMDAGGDGTEYLDARKIHWFYSLSPEDRERVREGSDLEGEESEDVSVDSYDSEDEELGLTSGSRKLPKAIS